MKALRRFTAAAAILLLTGSVSLDAAEGWTQFRARPGPDSMVRIEGTSTIHDWHVVSRVMQGSFEAGPNFSMDASKATAGKVDARCTLSIVVRTLKSVEKDGRTPYSEKMDEIMYEHLKMSAHPKIEYKLTELTLKQMPKTAGEPFVFDAQGDLSVAGVTKKIQMPVKMLTPDEGKLKFTGAVDLKMTDFGVEPPAPTLAGGLIKTGDDIKLTFDWLVQKR